MVYTFDSSMTGAPVLSGTAGALRAVLKACLVDGFGAGSVATLTVASGIATATFAGAHPYRIGTIAQFGGATPAGLNGQKRILSTTASAVTFDATGIADGTATGTITHKVAAAGWQELFAGTLTNVIVLKPTVPEATGCVLRVDDTDAMIARAVGYQAMSTASAGTGPFPSVAMISGGQYWWKSNSVGVSPRAWRLFADGRLLYLWVASGGDRQGQGVVAIFGDINSAKTGDAGACAINGFDSAINTVQPQSGCAGFGNAAAAANANFVMAFSHLGVGGAQLAKKTAAHNLGAGYSGTTDYNTNALVFPNGPDNALRLAPVEVIAVGSIRGVLPGLYHSPQLLTNVFNTGDLVAGTGAFAGRIFCALVTGSSTGVITGVVFVDTTGWR